MRPGPFGAAGATPSWPDLMRRLPRPGLRPLLALAALVSLLAWQGRLVGDWRVDDAYISFSFAKNLASGKGLVYSWGERVEGYSNFLWVVLTSGAYVVRDRPAIYATSRALSWCFLALLFAAVDRLVRRREGPLASFFALALLAATTDLVRATLSGLETVPYVALVTAGAAHYLHEAPGRRGRSLWWFVAAALMRIDGFVPLLFALGFEAASAFYERRLDARAFSRWAAPPLAAYALYFAARWAYYGLPLPATYYAKDAVTAGAPYRGHIYLWEALRDFGAPVTLAFGLFSLRRPGREALFVALFALYYGAYVIATGGDWMPFNRFALPLAPFLVVAFVWGMCAACRACAARGAAAGRLAAACAAASYLFVAVRVDGHVVDSPGERAKGDLARHIDTHTRENLIASAPWVRMALRGPGDKLVSDYAGVFAVHTDANIIDMWGLCNADIARRGTTEGIAPIYGKTCPACYREFDPDYFHVMVPLVRPAGAFTSHAAVVAAVFQGHAIDRHVDLKGRYATGRVREPASGRALYFLERRRQDRPLSPRSPAPGFVVEYPFEPGGL